MSQREELNHDNYMSHFFRFEKRQAGVSFVYCHETEMYSYNAYCFERDLLKELFSVEYDFLDDALKTINEEFGSWELVPYEQEKSGCSTCVAKS